MRNLLLLILFLEDPVEVGNNMPVDLDHQQLARELFREDGGSHDLSTIDSGRAV
jgi:hypothetical protein